MKVPAFISNKVERNGDNCILTLTTKQAKIAAIVGSILIIVALVFGIWGIVRQAEVVQLRQQTQLQSEQLKLLQQKTDVLDKKIQNLNQISEENKQMLKGAESGTPSQGGGDGSDPKQPAADESEVKTLTAAQLSARLSKMDKDAQKLLCNPLTSLLDLVVLQITLHQVSGRARALLPLHLVAVWTL